MTLGTLGKVLRGVGQVAGTVVQFTPAGAAITKGLTIAQAMGNKGAEAMDPRPSIFTSPLVNITSSIELDGNEGTTLREIAVYQVLTKLDSFLMSYQDQITKGEVKRSIDFSEYLSALTTDVETWLQAEQIEAVRKAGEVKTQPIAVDSGKK